MRGQVKKTSEKGKLKQGKQQQEQYKAVGLELQEYVFDGAATRKFLSKEECLETYRERADNFFNETVELYEQVKAFPKPDVILKDVRDHVKDTLSLAMNVGNKVFEVNVNLRNIPATDIIHLNNETSDMLNTRLLKVTIQVSKLESNKKKTLDLLRKERVENKALRIKIKKLQDDLLKSEGNSYQGGATQKLLYEKEKEV